MNHSINVVSAEWTHQCIDAAKQLATRINKGLEQTSFAHSMNDGVYVELCLADGAAYIYDWYALDHKEGIACNGKLQLAIF